MQLIALHPIYSSLFGIFQCWQGKKCSTETEIGLILNRLIGIICHKIEKKNIFRRCITILILGVTD